MRPMHAARERGQATLEYGVIVWALVLALFLPLFDGRSVLVLFVEVFDIYINSFHFVIGLPIP